MRQQVQRRRIGAAVHRRDLTQEVLLPGFGVFDENVEVPPLRKDLRQRVQQLELRLLPPAVAILFHEARVRESHLRIAIEHLHIRVRGCVVEVEVVLLHVLPVVSLIPRQAKEAFFQNRVLAIPQGHGQTEVLKAVTHAP